MPNDDGLSMNKHVDDEIMQDRASICSVHKFARLYSN